MAKKVKLISSEITKMMKDPAFAKNLEEIADDILAQNNMKNSHYETEISQARKDRAVVNIKDVSKDPNAFANQARTGELNKLAGRKLT